MVSAMATVTIELEKEVIPELPNGATSDDLE